MPPGMGFALFPIQWNGSARRACIPGLAPTQWQASTFPEGFRDKITVIHDGIDTNRLMPNPGAGLTLNNSIPVTRQDEVITFVNRNLEPYRNC
jgi:glycosyltransferase involved in cell wall biosynthesis